MNILVTKFYNVVDHSKWYNDRTQEQNLEDNYLAMIELMKKSAREYVLDLDDIIVHGGIVSDIREAFQQHYWQIRELWKQGHNILYVDADVLFTKPVKIFGEFDEFQMFNYTDPRCLNEHPYVFPNYFNCGIRYYPSTMSQATWQWGDTGFRSLDRTNWDNEQRIYNQMLWSHTPAWDFNQCWKPELAYQLITGNSTLDDEFNGISIEQARIVHIHGSRGSSNRLHTMQKLWDKYGNNKMTYDKMLRLHYRDFNTVANFSHTSESELELMIKDHCTKFGVVRYEVIEPQDLTFDDLVED